MGLGTKLAASLTGLDRENERARVLDILAANKHRQFVQRILTPARFPHLKRLGGERSTHRMAWLTAADGKSYAYPTILYEDGKLKQYEPMEAWSKVSQSGDFIPFDSEQDADWFSKRYKAVWEADRAPEQ